jgi:hypothetical protein
MPLLHNRYGMSERVTLYAERIRLASTRVRRWERERKDMEVRVAKMDEVVAAVERAAFEAKQKQKVTDAKSNPDYVEEDPNYKPARIHYTPAETEIVKKAMLRVKVLHRNDYHHEWDAVAKELVGPVLDTVHAGVWWSGEDRHDFVCEYGPRPPV